jgi:predicted component of viral defense system (DUF524 family)
MSATEVPEARWGAYRVEPRGTAPLFEHPDGSLELLAEREYVVEMPPDARERVWQALTPLRTGLWLLRFGNFVGESELGGRRLLVTSNRLRHEEVDAMFDDVVSALHSLPFYFDTPTSLAYARDVLASDDVLYQAYAFLRQALEGMGPHDLPSAVERILARPHMRLVPTLADVPLARADRVDADTVMSLARRPGPLHPIPPSSPLAGSPIAAALRMKAPESVRSGRMIETTQTPENEFVVTVLDTARAIVDRFRIAVSQRYPERAEWHFNESDAYASLLDRWRRHPTLDGVAPARRFSLASTVLRGRPGYRQVTRFFVDLQARARLLDAADAQRLLEARDAALIYEYWCYFQVVEAVATVLGRSPLPTRFEFGSFGSTVPHAYAADFGSVRVWFNRSFHPPRSYSVPLRPDITLERADGTLHLFDAKLKREAIPAGAVSEADLEAEEQRATFRRGDLYKMHTYRDALGAQSVWILYPGRNVNRASFEPQSASRDGETTHRDPNGVGAIPLLPGQRADREQLDSLVAEMLPND